MSFSLCFGMFILSFVIVNGVNAFEGDINGMKNEFSLKNTNKILPASNPYEFDCVDIYKQPAFDHPLLRNHKIQLEPSFLKDSKKFLSKSSCPPGKVPIAKARTNHPGNLESVNSDHPSQHFALVESEPGYTLHGVRSLIELHNPHPLEKFQFSLATMWVLNGPESELNSLQAGWAVHPLLYNDNYTHLTICWTIDNFVKTGCYNTRCPGFVQVDDKFYPGQSMPEASDYNKDHISMDLSILQDYKTGNWWFALNGEIGIGYWPKEIFTHLSNEASQVIYGGWTSTLAPEPSPPMGNGNYGSKDLLKSSTFAKLTVLDSLYKEIGSSRLSMRTRVDAPNCYSAIYLDNQSEKLGDVLSYGGPGGASCGV